MTQRFIGGMRLAAHDATQPSLWPGSSFRATPPLAELLIDEERQLLVLRARWKWLRALGRAFVSPRMSEGPLRFDAEWVAPLDAVTAEPFRKWGITSGVLLKAPDHPPAIFWCDGSTQQRIVLDLLAPR